MTAPKPQLVDIKAVLEGAYEPPIDDFGGPPWDGRDDGGAGYGGDDEGEISMPAGCPVEPLGTWNNLFYFLTALGELRALAADKVANKHIVGMFAPFTPYLFDQWPRKKEVPIRDDAGKIVKDAEGNALVEWIVTGWRADDVSLELMRVCGARGVWSPRDKVRGRGAHVDEHGRLILHCGNQILFNGTWSKPSIYDGFVYPTAPAIARPGPRPDPKKPAFSIEVDGEHRPAPAGIALLHWLRKWNWARPSIDPILALGFIAIARYGGAIAWRPLAWITGGAGEGKSTLMELIGDLFQGGLLKLESASEAAVRQLLGQDTLPVVLDEQEATTDERKMEAIIGLARIAASGGNIGKGGQDHQGVQFTARSCFLFSSILIPPLMPADKSRMAVLELKRLPAGSREPKISAAERRDMCAAVSRRMVDHWGRWPRLFEAFSDALIDIGGHKGRGAKVFGTLLTAAHIMLDDDPPEEAELAMWGRQLAVSRLAELADSDGDDKRCLQHLGTSLVQLDGRGQQRLISDWVDQAVRTAPSESIAEDAREMEAERRKARDQLAKIGLGIIVGRERKRGDIEDEERPRPVPGRTYLAVANAHQGLARIFADSDWKSRAGASGVWVQSLKRIEGAVPGERQRIGRTVTACTLVPIEAMWRDDLAEVEASTGADQAREDVDA